MMRLYMTPGACSIGIHILLEELDQLFEAHVVDLMAGDHRRPGFLAINPRGTIPTLVRDDGIALTDFQAIALWLAQLRPDLLPSDEAERARAMHVMGHAVDLIHGQGFTRVFVPEGYADGPEGQSAVQHEGRGVVARGFARVEPWLTGERYVLDRFTVADVALFYVEFWADRVGIPMPARCQVHYRAMLARPAVRRVLAEEGYASTLRTHLQTPSPSPYGSPVSDQH